jgi:hypothetical protein
MVPVCSFCGERPVVGWFEGPDFLRFVDAPEKVRANEAWLACSTCLSLIQAGDRDGLVQRGTQRIRKRSKSGGDSPNIEPAVGRMHERFWAACPA